MSEPQKKDRPFLGHAVKDGKIRFTSASQIVSFDKEHEGCPSKWAYPYVFGIKLPKTKALLTGINNAEQLEAWLTRGEMVLSSVLQEGKKFFPYPRNHDGVFDLECERPLGDIETAFKLREQFLAAEYGAEADELLVQMRKAAGVIAHGVPLEGAADCRHFRGEYVDEMGVLRTEYPGTKVVEIVDLKVISQINTYTTRGGKEIKGWAKTAAQVCDEPQMLAYAMQAIERNPGLTHVRLAHVYCQKKSKGAAKRMGLLTVDEVIRRWHRVEDVVAQMEVVATAKRIEDVPFNKNACDSYTHVDPVTGQTAKGCGYKYQCPHFGGGVAVTEVNLFGNSKESGMSLLDQLAIDDTNANTGNGTPPPPTLSAADHEKAVAEEMARLAAAEAARSAQPPAVVSQVNVQERPGAKVLTSSCVEGSWYFVDCEDGKQPLKMRFEGTSRNRSSGEILYMFKAEDGSRASCTANDSVWELDAQVVAPAAPPQPQLQGVVVTEGRALDAAEIQQHYAAGPVASSAPPAPPVVPAAPVTLEHPGQVVPPDAPKITNLLDAAAPLSDAAIAEITDPDLKARAIEHQRLHREKAAAEAAAAPKKEGAGNCNGGGMDVKITPVQALKKKVTCPVCGQERPVSKEAKEAILAGATETVMKFPNHRREAPQQQAAPPTPPAPPSAPPAPPQDPAAYLAPGALPGQTPMPPSIVVPPAPPSPPAPPAPPAPPIPPLPPATSMGQMTGQLVPHPANVLALEQHRKEVDAAARALLEGGATITSREIEILGKLLGGHVKGMDLSLYSNEVVGALRKLRLVA